ncbi:MAG: hypothetical protein KAU16_05365 [Methanophagales archaeon]|nr:hypothetical protein [Methanophagales archaeon]
MKEDQNDLQTLRQRKIPRRRTFSRSEEISLKGIENGKERDIFKSGLGSCKTWSKKDSDFWLIIEERNKKSH